MFNPPKKNLGLLFVEEIGRAQKPPPYSFEQGLLFVEEIGRAQKPPPYSFEQGLLFVEEIGRAQKPPPYSFEQLPLKKIPEAIEVQKAPLLKPLSP